MTSGLVELVCPERPPSVNNRFTKGRGAFDEALAAAWRSCAEPTRTELLYGLVVWFVRGYRTGTDPDADNISKAVWDALEGLQAFKDDKQVRLRTAVIVDLEASRLEDLDLTGLPARAGRAIEALIKGPASKRRGHVTYVRFGALAPDIVGGALRRGRSSHEH